MPDHAFAEPRAISRGIGPNAQRRNAPTVLDVGLRGPPFDWDGHADDLEGQLERVFSLNGDMGMDLDEAVARLGMDRVYDELFRRTLGRAPDREGVVAALVAFETTLVSEETRFERFYLGGDSLALTDVEQRGWRLFRDPKAGCAGCHVPLPDPHSGVMFFTDNRFHNLGIGVQGDHAADPGRFEVTGRPADWGAFRTPSLRNVAHTAPYMHDGSLATLEEVVDFYARGGVANRNLDPVLVERDLGAGERADLIAFLRSVSATWLEDSVAVSERLRAFAGPAREQ